MFVLAQAAEDQSSNFLVSPNVGLMIWTLLSFFVAMFILRKWAWPAITSALDKRQRAIEESIETAERTRSEAQELLAEYRERLKEARSQADEMHDSRELQTFFFSPYFSTEEKKQGLGKAVVDADPTVRNFLELLVENHRMPAIFRARRELDRLWQETHQLLPVQITSAVELDEGVVKRIGDEIGRQTGRTVELTATVDPEVIGGIVLRVGNSILDASIRTRLERLRKQVAKA